jgi:hypothetical protein
MSIKERVLRIQETIDELQSDIFRLDENLNYYNVLIVNQCVNPMEVRLFREDKISGTILVATLYVNFMDQYVDQMSPEQLNNEFKHLRESNAPVEQTTELTKLREFFGV